MRPVVRVHVAALCGLFCLAAAAGAPAAAPASRPAAIARCDSLIQARQFAAAAACAQAYLDQLDALGPSDAPEAAETLAWLLLARVNAPDKLDAGCAALSERLLALVRRHPGPASWEMARAETRAGQVAEKLGRYPAAREAYARALAARQAAHLPDDADAVMARLNLANVRARLNDYDGLDAYYGRTLAIADSTVGPGSALAASVLVNQAIYRKLCGDLAGARVLYEKSLAIKIALQGEQQPDVARLYFNLGNLLVDAGDLAEARRVYAKSLAIREKLGGPQSLDVARSLTALAIMEKRAANLLLARDYAERSLSIQERALPPDHPQRAEALNALAAIESDLGDLDAARQLFEQALGIYTRAYGPDHRLAGGVIAELGWLDYLGGDQAAALASFRRARATYETAAADDDHVPALLNTEAVLLVAAGRGREGLALADRSVALRRRALAPGSPALGWSLETLGACLWQAGAFARADSALHAARTILAAAWGEDHPVSLTAAFDLARAHAALGENREALDLALDVARGRRESLRLTIAGLPERLALTFADRWPRGLDLALTLAADAPRSPGDLARIWSELIRSRGLVLDEIAARRPEATTLSATAADSLRRALSDATRELAGLLVQGWQEGQAADVHDRSVALRARREAIERKLAETESRSAASAGEVTLAGIAARLPAGTALVGYTRYERTFRPPAPGAAVPPEGFTQPSYAAFVLPAGARTPEFADLGPADEIDRLIRNWRDEAGLGAGIPGRSPAAAEAGCRRAGMALRERIWDPLAARLGPARTVCLVPDGELNLVSFAALPVGQDRYLIDDERRLVYLETERNPVESRRQRKAPGELLAIGAPDFATTRAPLAFAPLPAAADEVATIASLWRRARPAAGREAIVTRTGTAASEEAFKSLAPRYRVLHVATHGFYLEAGAPAPGVGRRGIGGLQAQAPAAVTARDERAPAANPMLRSGLVLAGGGAAGDDGILTAAEIAILDLGAVDGVVLSACESGVGAAWASEGVFGLRRAFRIAGARDLVLTLWPLSDQQMRDWMLGFYDAHLAHGADLAAAAWQASRAVLAQRRAASLDTHPHTWAGFIACGN
jgi:CHAT domain-containing protein